MARARTAVLSAAGVAVVGGAGLATIGLGGGGDPAAARGSLPPATAPVERTTLVETQDVDGTLGYGGTRTVAGAGRGTLTWLPRAGSVISRGEPVYKVDDEPVPLLYGRLPLYRTLAPGTEGADVEQLERNLHALGHTGFTVDDAYSAATAAAVRRWQDDLGMRETGRVAPGAAVVASGRIRVAERKAHVGGGPGGTILTCTGTRRVVSVDLDVRYQRLAKKGAEVGIELPSGGTAEGRITSVGKVAKEGGADRPTTIAVTIAVGDQRSLGSYDKAPVRVRLTANRHRGVLAVPVGALLARGDGGYAVQVVRDGRVRTVPVETGVFTAGMVEVSGAGLAEGMQVGVPA
ncbi:peptidoglycan-binding protein [Actinomadura livida]|uniref:Peptidoglycan hydrolase-like protein with peptidoglycan-binding domain n=1 Tax=Actinomadura livida TaxID=79909 RepID=A0A7W7IE29_9ACTN|nr:MULTISPECIES: peptidoglycan-binding protein [Actinomadura]MBB4775008.1 peptidoglycan hydrolase-like protein with peptidoglycan-binding domain [Actinomadura catellatispora]GGT87173.1 peptidoglycan-binding protein [Actinomadura livida]